MNDSKKGPNGRRRGKNTYITRSGRAIKLNRSLSDRMKASKQARAAKRATYLSTLPKNRIKRILYRLHPRRVAQYWFSREGAIMALKVTGIGIVVCFFLVIGVFAYFRKDLPKIKDISGNNLGGSITYMDRTGKVVLWQDYDAVKRIPVEDSGISQYMKDATVAIEDKDFYNHGAFDMRGIMRAGFHDIFGSSGTVQGGSTITQQLVKLNQDWTEDRTITRKVKELILAVELEREYSKKDILTGYLNVAPYGGVEYGIESAARDYFHTDAKHLTLAQSAMLAAIPQAPAYYSPYSSPDFNTSASANLFKKTGLINRQHYILDQMVKQGMITQKQADEAKKVDVLAQVHPLQPKYKGIKSPYFVLAAKQELERKYGATTVQRGGWKVTTTMDSKLQNLAEEQVKNDLPLINRYGGDVAAFAAEDIRTGQMVALVGGVDFTNPEYGQINYAQTPIPPGSSFKPYDYAALINFTNAGAGSVLYDNQGPLPGYPCTNKNIPKYDDNANCLWDYDFRYPGPLTLRYALAGSRNVPAVKAMLSVEPKNEVASVNKVISTAEKMQSDGKGFGYNCYSDTALKHTTQCYGSSAIGDGAYLHLDEHVNGLATLGRLGTYLPQTYILKIQDSAGKTISQWTQPKGKQVIKPDAAYIVNDMLSDPKATYFNSSYKFQHQPNGWHFAVKTGTTNDNFDGLMTSWSSKYASAAWVGYHTRNKALVSGSMETMTAPITRGWMEGAHANLPADNWKQPSGVKKAPAFVVRAHVGLGSVEPSPSTDLFPSWYQTKTSGGSQTIDKVSNKLATSCTPELARLVATNSNANTFSIDNFINGGSSSSYNITANDDVHNCDDAPPVITLTAPEICTDKPSGCEMTATVTQGTHPLSSSKFKGNVSFAINDQTVKNFTVSESPQAITFAYTPTTSGSATVTATVTDSALYQSSDSATFTMSASPKPNGNGGSSNDGSGDGSLQIVNPPSSTSTAHRGDVTIMWSGGSGPYTVHASGGNDVDTSDCQNVSGNDCAVTFYRRGDYNIYVQDADGAKSRTVTISVN